MIEEIEINKMEEETIVDFKIEEIIKDFRIELINQIIIIMIEIMDIREIIMKDFKSMLK